MKIVDVSTITLSYPLKKPVRTSFGLMHKRTGVLVKIDTDEGISGIGESWTNYPHWAPDERRITIEKGLKPLLMGENPLNISYLWNKMYVSLMKSGAGLQYCSKGPLYQAVSGVDIALWDILGKKFNTPVYQLLGGMVCKEIKVYASGLGPEDYENMVEDSINQGYNAFKMKVGFGKELDKWNLKNIRSMIGDNCLLMADANQRWENAAEALENIKEFQDYNLKFIEEPVPANKIYELKKIKDSGLLPVAGGENLYSRHDFKETLEIDAIDIAQPDVTKTGGISEARLICQMAAAWGIPFAPHMFGTAVGLAASLHVFLSTPGGLIMEVDANPNPLRTDLLKDKFFRLEKGSFVVDKCKPGLGIELDESAVKEFS